MKKPRFYQCFFDFQIFFTNLIYNETQFQKTVPIDLGKRFTNNFSCAMLKIYCGLCKKKKEIRK